MPIIVSVINCGICSTVKTFENADAQDRITKIVPVVQQDVANVLNSSLASSSLWINVPQINAYITATAAASVGVKIPKYMPPKIINGLIKAHFASHTALNALALSKGSFVPV